MPVRSSRLIHERYVSVVLVVTAVFVGGVGWSGYVLALPITILFPRLWAMAPNRMTAAAVSAGYFLAASRGLPQGVVVFFGSTVWAGILLWLAASLAFVSVHTALASRCSDPERAIRYGTAALLMAIPPFGIVGWAHPITAAGVLFPGWGWAGLAVTFIALILMTMRVWPIAALLALAAWVWSAVLWTSPPPMDGWHGVDTRLAAAAANSAGLDRQRLLAGIVRERAASGAGVVVLPESALGILTPTVERFWTDALAGIDVTVVAGAAVLNHNGYDNVLAMIDQRDVSILYRERMPVPVSMWQPWRRWLGSEGGARATFFADPVVEVRGKRIAPLICYEQLLIWPILQSALFRPDMVVAIANGWWAADTSVPAIQIATTTAWARLFALPSSLSFNL